MRTTTYKCDRCGKTILSRTAVKINTTMQRGTESVEKQTCDFCNKCFLYMKKVWANALSTGVPAESDETVDEKQPETKITMKDIMNGTLDDEPAKDKPDVKQPVKRGPYRSYNKPYEVVQTVQQPAVKKRGRKPKPEEMPVPGEDGMVQGRITPMEQKEILRLYVDEGLSVEEIAARLHRLTKGVARYLNAAEKAGELDEYHKLSELRKKQDEEARNAIHNLLSADEDDTSEDNRGSGASNSGVTKDSYTGQAQTMVYDGRKYDVGGVMALYKAGWKIKDIAAERNYDEDVVMLIIENFYKEGK